MRRRTVLAAACGLALSACAWRARPAQLPPRMRLRLSWAGSDGMARAAVRAYAAVRPEVELWMAGPEGDPAKVDLFQVWSALDLRGQFQSLAKPLATLNADLGGLLSGWHDAYAQDGIPWALPYGLSHLLVAVRQDAIDQWRLRADWSTWDVAGIRDVCLAIRAAGAAPLERDGLLIPAVWTAFVIGFGGRLDPSGQPILQAPGTVAGLQTLAELVRLAGTPPQAWTRYAPTAPVTVMDSATLAAGQAAGVHPPQVVAARFPRLPRQAVIPTSAPALAVTKACGNVLESVRFMLWLLGPQGQSLVGAAHLQPVRGDVAAQPSPLPGVTDRGGLAADASDDRLVPAVQGRYEVGTRTLLLQAAQNPAVLSSQAPGM